MSRCYAKCPHLQLIVTHTNAIRGHCRYYSTDLKTNPYPAYRNSGPYRCLACVDEMPRQEPVQRVPKNLAPSKQEIVLLEAPMEAQIYFTSSPSRFADWYSDLRALFNRPPPPPPPPPVVPLSPPLVVQGAIDTSSHDTAEGMCPAMPCIIDPEDP